MADEAARGQRLTELARRLWPDLVQVRVRRANHACVELVVETPHFHRVVLSVDHARALDALEAALCVLAGEQVAPDPRIARIREWLKSDDCDGTETLHWRLTLDELLAGARGQR